MFSCFFVVVILISVMFVMMHLRCSHVHCVFVSSTSISEKSDMNPDSGKFEDFRVELQLCHVETALRRSSRHAWNVLYVSITTEMNLRLLSCWSLLCYISLANAILERRPSLLTPSGVRSETKLVKGEDLRLECVAEGLWVHLQILHMLETFVQKLIRST